MSLNIEGVNGGYMAFNSGALAIGTTTGTFKIVAAVNYTNNGIFKNKAITDNVAFTAGHTSLAASQACLFALWIDASGTVTTTQGPIVPSSDNCPVPTQKTANVTLIGLIKVKTSSAQTYVPGTDALGTGNTAAYTNCSTMPGTSQ